MQKQIGQIAAALAAFTIASDAATFTYTGGGNWNKTDASWNDGTGDGKLWSDGNDAVFPAGKEGWVLIAGTPEANNVTVNGTDNQYYLNWGALKVSGKVIANASFSFKGVIASDSIRLGGAGNKMITFDSEASRIPYYAQTKTYLEDSIVVAPGNDGRFGPVPASPTENIVVLSGSPMLYGNVSLNANRNIRIAAGATLRLGAWGQAQAFTVNGTVSGEPDATLGFVTNTIVKATYNYDWTGGACLNPGAGKTNDVGRLYVNGKLRLASGTTRIGNVKDDGTRDDSALFVSGNNSEYSDSRGNLVVDGATLYDSQTGNYRYIWIENLGQVTVTNGGRIFMPGTHYLNAKGRLTVGDGEFVANVLRVSQATTSEIYLDEGGLIAVNRLGIDPAATHACQFKFNGGRIQSRGGSGTFLGTVSTTATTDSDWDTVVFSVGEKGAGFDSTNGQNIWWTRPLVQASGVEDDGGVFVVGTRTDRGLILTKANTYNGPTVVSNAELQVRADNALPSGSTLRLVGGAVWADTFETESPARRTVQSLGRLEGSGTIYNSWNVTVNGAIAPDTDGTLYLAERCSLSGDFEIRGDAGGCGCLKVAANQSIAGLTLKAADMAAMDTDAARNTYKILDAPNGYTGQFALASDFPSDKWKVRYTGTAAYIDSVAATMIIMR